MNPYPLNCRGFLQVSREVISEKFLCPLAPYAGSLKEERLCGIVLRYRL